MKTLLYIFAGMILMLLIPGCGIAVTATSMPIIAAAGIALILARVVRGAVRWIVVGVTLMAALAAWGRSILGAFQGSAGMASSGDA